MLGNGMGKKHAAVSLSNNTVKRTISDKDQVVREIESAAVGLFSIQLYELTDVASCPQLLLFARYVHSGSFRGVSLLFCSSNNYQGLKYFGKGLIFF